MPIPLQISFRNMDPSPAVEERIRQKAAKLERFHDRIVGCTVVVEAPHRHHHKGKLYNVRVDISVPGKDVVVDRAKPTDHAHEDVYVAVRDAFNAAVRRLEDQTRKMRGERQDACRPAASPKADARSHAFQKGWSRQSARRLARLCAARSLRCRARRGLPARRRSACSASTARPSAISAWRVARSLRAPRASCTSFSAASESCLRLALGLPRKRGGEELGRVAQPLGADAQFVALLDAQMAQVGSPCA